MQKFFANHQYVGKDKQSERQPGSPVPGKIWLLNTASGESDAG